MHPPMPSLGLEPGWAGPTTRNLAIRAKLSSQLSANFCVTMCCLDIINLLLAVMLAMYFHVYFSINIFILFRLGANQYAVKYVVVLPTAIIFH